MNRLLSLFSCLGIFLTGTLLSAQTVSIFPSSTAHTKKEMKKTLRSATTEATIYGCIWDSWGEYWTEPGMFAFSTSSSQFTPVANAGSVKVYGGATIVEDKYYATYYKEEGTSITMPIRLTIYNTESWQPEQEYTCISFTGISTDLAYDHVSQELYGCFMNGDYTEAKTLGIILLDDNQGTYSVKVVGTLPERITALTFDEEGRLYGISETAKLYLIDKTSGSATLIGEVADGIKQWGFQSACYDKESGKILWAGNDSRVSPCLYEVDPTTGHTEIIVNFGDTETYDQMLGIYLRQNFEKVRRPKMVTALQASFTAPNLSGTISFTMPEEDIYGDRLSSTSLDYIVSLGDKVVAQNSASPGENVSVGITAPRSDLYDIQVKVGNESHQSDPAHLSYYIGYDTPLPPSAFKASVEEEITGESATVALSWTAPSAGVHNGYLDTEALNYTIIRYPDAVTIVSDLTASTYTDHINSSIKQKYHYEITASSHGMKSSPSRSGEILIGNMRTLPYYESFDSAEEFNSYTIVDANEDGSTWSHINGYAQYIFNSENAADDYLITPPFQLKANFLYIVTVNARNTYPTERIAAYAGTKPTAEAMQTEVFAPTEITHNENPKTISGSFKPTEDGIYYFSIKAMSDKDRSTLYIDDITIEERSTVAPNQVQSLTVTPGEKGALKAQISFTLPSDCIDGSALTHISKVSILRNDLAWKELTEVSPNEKVEIQDDNINTPDLYRYTVIVYNEAGAGQEASTEAFVGIDVPGPVRNLKASEDPKEIGTVILSWDAPLTGQHGGYIDPNGLTYFISKGISGANDINNGSHTTYRDPLDISKGQTYEGYSIYATNSTGSGRNVWSTITTVAGPPVIAPLYESFAHMHIDSGPWLNEMIKGKIGQASWTFEDGSRQQSKSQDWDNGILLFEATSLGCSSRIVSPKISLKELAKPELSFWVYQTGNRDSLVVSVSPDFGPHEKLRTILLNEGTGWQRYTCDLSNYLTYTAIRIGFAGIAVERLQEIISLDNISVAEQSDSNLSAIRFVAPEKSFLDTSTSFSVTVRNSGNKIVSGDSFSLQLYKNDQIISTSSGSDMEPGASIEFVLYDIPTRNDEKINIYHAKIQYDQDTYLTDNVTNSISLPLILPEYPTPRNLSAIEKDGGVYLSWDAPDLSSVQQASVTESFDTYESFIINNIGTWTTIDSDALPTIRITLGAGMTPLDYPNAGKPMSFQVFNTTEAGIPFTSWEPHSGEQMIVSFKPSRIEDDAVSTGNDDWLISPQLSGKAQTISFYAKTGMNAPYIPEVLEVLYSKKSNDNLEDFTRIGDPIELNNVKEWQEHRIKLPDGARYFALRCTSNDKFALLIDDITYIPYGAKPIELNLLGYHIYEHGNRISDDVITTTNYTDLRTLNIGETREYTATAVYDRGESIYSSPVSILITTLKDVIEEDILISTSEEQLHIKGLTGETLYVYDIYGRVVHYTNDCGDISIPLMPGTYIIRIANAYRKVQIP